nr:hypothetical protein [Tanacetum cinerariifolium]
MIHKPGDPNSVPPVTESTYEQTTDELTEKEVKQIEVDDQVIHTILMGLLEDIYAAVDSFDNAQEIWLRVKHMMKCSSIGIQEKKAKLFNESKRSEISINTPIKDKPIHRIKLLSDMPYQTIPNTAYQARDLAVRLRMVYIRGDRQQVFVSHAWKRLFGIRAPLVHEFILEFLSICRMSDTEMGLDVADTLCFQLDQRPVRRLCHKMIAYSISGRGHAPEKVTGVDLFYLRNKDRGTANVPYLLARYLFRHAEGRKSGSSYLGVTSLDVLQLILDWLLIRD